MERFTKLFCALDQTTRTNEKVSVLESYFRDTPPEDAAWALQFLSGRIPKRLVPNRSLWNWTTEECALPQWLMDECYDSVGDFAETMALLLPDAGTGTDLHLARIVHERLLPLRDLPDGSRRQLLLQTWRELSPAQRLVWNKLITGEFRVGVARTLVIRALANVAEIEPAIMSHRVMGDWQPTPADFLRIMQKETSTDETARAYPFFLASPIEIKMKPGEGFEKAFDHPGEWQFEWKWDGIRAQLIHRNNETCLWSRGDEMVTDSFPELETAGEALPNGTVLDGEIVGWNLNAPLPFASLQKRLGRKKVDQRIQQSYPVAFLAYDLLERNGKDIRSHSLAERRAQLELLLESTRGRWKSSKGTIVQGSLDLFAENHDDKNDLPLRLSPTLQAETWDALIALQNESRSRGVEGIMLKRRSSPYGTGRTRGDWWKWKIEPFHVDAVLIYAQRGHGRRASLYSDYTFGLWENGHLVPVAKAYSGLTDAEIRQVDAFVRNNTIDKHGPVRILRPELVFELAFEGIQKSTRHKAGIALRFPRMHRWRQDKKPAEADAVQTLRSLLSNSKQAEP